MYSSAYDTDNNTFRLITFIEIVGAFVFAVCVPNFFNEEHNTARPIAGYVIMRIAMVIFWLRAAAFDVQRANTYLCYAAGITTVQVLWVANYFVPKEIFPYSTVVL